MIVLRFMQYRLRELFVWLGIPLLGVFLSGVTPGLLPLSLFILATALLIFHTLLLNDWGGQIINPAERSRVVLRPGEGQDITPLASASMLALLMSTALYAVLETRLLIPLIYWVILSLLYSHPLVHLKGKAEGSFILHLIGGSVMFLQGYLFQSNDFITGIMLSLFFSLIFTAGSLVHQCQHESEDKEAGLDTTAIRYGNLKTIRWAIGIFILAHIYLFVLALTGRIEWKITIVLALGLIAHIKAIQWFSSRQVDFSILIPAYQRLYRNLYGTTSMILIIVMFA
jgi:1,4-dihydroxy-2-naphthoate octaprenyltransferase